MGQCEQNLALTSKPESANVMQQSTNGHLKPVIPNWVHQNQASIQAYNKASKHKQKHTRKTSKEAHKKSMQASKRAHRKQVL